jgi:hypothetical protein
MICILLALASGRMMVRVNKAVDALDMPFYSSLRGTMQGTFSAGIDVWSFGRHGVLGLLGRIHYKTN